jgi:hypothetical protein
MKYALATMTGVFLGSLAGLVFLYFNPMTAESQAPAIEPTAVLTYELPSGSSPILTHGGGVRLAARPPEIARLWETTVSKTALSVLVLRSVQGAPVAIASRVSKLAEASNLLLGGMLLTDYWLVTEPGRGSYFLAAESNIWPLIRDTLVDVDYFGRDWAGARRYTPTVGPEALGTALISGATGDFEQARGSAIEAFQLSDYRGDSRFRGTISGEIQLQMYVPEDGIGD